MNDKPIVLLAGEQSRVVLHDLLSAGTLIIRVLTADPTLGAVLAHLGVQVTLGHPFHAASIRAAVRGCWGVFAVPDDVEQGRRLIKVIAGADVDRFVLAAAQQSGELAEYARAIGLEPILVCHKTPEIAISLFLDDERKHASARVDVPYLV